MSPNCSILRTFGCTYFVLLSPHEQSKLQPRSHLCCFLGYGIEYKGYRCYDPVAQRSSFSTCDLLGTLFFSLLRVDLGPFESTPLFNKYYTRFFFQYLFQMKEVLALLVISALPLMLLPKMIIVSH